MKRRTFVASMGMLGLGLTGFRFWPDEGFWNQCLRGGLPAHLQQHDVVTSAWQGLDPRQVWDCHVHLIGIGDHLNGTWVNPEMQSLGHPIQFTQFRFYLNASCATEGDSTDQAFVDRLLELVDDMPAGYRVMLLAFDYRYNEQGQRMKNSSPFFTPNAYAARLASEFPDRFVWIASVHPYRRDALKALDWAVAHGARAVKWLPGVMGMDPSSPLCDAFYDGLARHNLPLLAHTGVEYAVHVEGLQHYNNPLMFRRPLAKGVQVILAHCASMGSSIDIDQGVNGPQASNFDLFKRMMQDERYQGRLFGDISAITQINRDIAVVEELIQRQDWHHRLVNGSDYPLPGVMPVFSLARFVERGYLQQQQADVLSEVRGYNPLLFDFLLKRHIRIKGRSFSDVLFESRRLFD